MRDDAFGIAKQAGSGAGGLGTENTTMGYWVPVESAERGLNQETMEAEETIGHPFALDIAHGVRYFNPTATGKVREAALPLLLASFLGAPATSTPDGTLAPTARKHVHDPVARPTPLALSLALLNRMDAYGVGDDDLYTILWDAIGSELTLSASVNDWLSFEAAWVAKFYDDVTSLPSPTPDASRRFPFHEIKVYASVNGGSEAELHCSDWSLNFNLNVPTDDAVLGSRDLFRVAPGNRDGELTFTAKEKVDVYFKRVIAADPDNLKIRMVALGPVIGGAVAHKVEVIAYRSQLTDGTVDVSAGDQLTGAEFTAHVAYDSTLSKFVDVEVTNTVASY